MTINWPETLVRVAAASGSAWARAMAGKNNAENNNVEAVRRSSVKPAQRFNV
jgi:enterochelin esterase-like enzyme